MNNTIVDTVVDILRSTKMGQCYGLNYKVYFKTHNLSIHSHFWCQLLDYYGSSGNSLL